MSVSDSEAVSRSQGDALRFQVLRPPGVWAGKCWLRMSGRGLRSLLAALLLRASLSLWRGRPPDGIDLGGGRAPLLELMRPEERRFALIEERDDEVDDLDPAAAARLRWLTSLLEAS